MLRSGRRLLDYAEDHDKKQREILRKGLDDGDGDSVDTMSHQNSNALQSPVQNGAVGRLGPRQDSSSRVSASDNAADSPTSPESNTDDQRKNIT